MAHGLSEQFKSKGKGKREDDEEEGDCKYVRLERRRGTPSQDLGESKLPENRRCLQFQLNVKIRS